MKKTYSKPSMIISVFDVEEYLSTSGTGTLKEGSDLNGCYKFNNASPASGCTPVYK